MTGSSGTPTFLSLQRMRILYESFQRDGADYRSHGPKLDKKWKSISGLPHPEGCAITRRSIQDAWRHADSTESARNALFETLIWGYGDDRFGPKKFDRIRFALDRSSGLLGELIKIRDTAQRQPVEAFRGLIALEITELKFVFATKVIYAMGANAPVLDQHIEKWLGRFGESMSPIKSAHQQRQPRRVEIYKEHLAWFHSMSEAHLNNEIEAVSDIALVEYIMFWDSKSENFRARKQQPNWLKGVPRWSDS